MECSLAPEDVKTVVKPLETNVLASRNRLRDHHEEFEHLLENLEFRDKLRDGMNDKWKSWNSWNSREEHREVVAELKHRDWLSNVEKGCVRSTNNDANRVDI